MIARRALAALAALASVAALYAALWLAAPAGAAERAQMPVLCDSREAFERIVAGLFGETRRLTAAAGDDGVTAELHFAAGGAWLIAFVQPDGRVCVAANGDGWEPAPAPPPGEPT